MQEREITSRIRIDELQGLLDTEEPATKQRITAPMPAVKLEELLQPEPPPPAPIQVTFRSKRPTTGHILPRPQSPETPSSAAPTLPGTTRRAAVGTPPPISLAGAGAADDFSDEPSSGDSRDTIRVTVRDTVRMATSGVLGVVNGVPVTVAVSGFNSGAVIAAGSNPEIRPPAPSGSIDAVIDAAVDAAIETEIHNAEIEAAIDAVVLPAPTVMTRQRYGIVAASFALSFVAGIVIMFLIG